MEDQPVVENEKLDRRWRTVRCAPCGNLGHNKKSGICQNGAESSSSLRKQKKGKQSCSCNSDKEMQRRSEVASHRPDADASHMLEVFASGNQRSEVVKGASQLSNVVGASQSSVSCACQSSLPGASQLFSAGASQRIPAGAS
ncbi:hypothetical protein Tco_0156955 [Tanacetum coccineum]